MDNIQPRIDLESLVGKHVLSGCDCNTEQVLDWGESYVSAGIMRFIMDGITYKAVENPDDGYRSSLEGLHLCPDSEEVKNIFAGIEVTAIYRSEGLYGDKDDVLELHRNSDGKLILEVGTCCIDDYYPGCVMNFIP